MHRTLKDRSLPRGAPGIPLGNGASRLACERDGSGSQKGGGGWRLVAANNVQVQSAKLSTHFGSKMQLRLLCQLGLLVQKLLIFTDRWSWLTPLVTVLFVPRMPRYIYISFVVTLSKTGFKGAVQRDEFGSKLYRLVDHSSRESCREFSW
jgi:hypothetical protein